MTWDSLPVVVRLVLTLPLTLWAALHGIAAGVGVVIGQSTSDVMWGFGGLAAVGALLALAVVSNRRP